MNRIWLLLVGAAFLALPFTSSAGEKKVYTVGKEALKIEGEVKADDTKIKVTHPEVKISVDLPAKVFEITLKGQTKYRVDVVSTKIDPVLTIQDKEGRQLAFDDDGGEGLNSRLDFSAPKDGVYKFVCATLKGEGEFTLTVKAGAATPPPPPGKTLEVGKGIKVNGELNADAKKITYKVKLEKGKTYVIDMISSNQNSLDPFLTLLDDTDKELAKDDDGGEGLNAQITFQAPESGTYQILATSFLGVGNGQFTLTVREKE